MKQVVDFVATDLSVVQRYIYDQYQLREDKPFRWLQRIAIFILRKLKCYAVIKEPHIRRISIDTRKFIERLYHQEAELFQHYDKHGDTILIGPEDLSQLISEEVMTNNVLRFSAEYLKPGEKGALKVMGMNVKVIPWMKGMLVMPKDAIQ